MSENADYYSELANSENIAQEMPHQTQTQTPSVPLVQPAQQMLPIAQAPTVVQLPPVSGNSLVKSQPSVNLREQLYAQVDALNKTIDEIIAEQCSNMEKQFELEKEALRKSQERLIGSVYTQEKIVSFPNVIELNVGGVFYTTSLYVLRKIPGTLLDLLFSGEYKMTVDPKTNSYFIDRNGELFKYILDFLRDGAVVLPSDEEDSSKRERILAEARYFGINLVSTEEEEEGNELAASLPDTLPYELFRPQWSFDPAVKNPQLILEDHNYTLCHTGNNSHASVIGTRGFSSGVHKWCIKLLGTPHWVGIGVCVKANLKTGYTTDYDHMWGASSTSQMYKMAGSLVNWVTNEVITCTLDCDSGLFQLKGNATALTSTACPPKTELFPIVNLYNSGNKITLLDEEYGEYLKFQ